jgi:hypothetical protein
VLALAAKAAIMLGSFLLAGSVLMLFLVRPGTDEFVITIINLMMGGALVGAGIVGARCNTRLTSYKEDL